MMTVRELLEKLEDVDLDAEVRFAGQPNWPFEYSICGIATSDDLDYDEEDHNLAENVVYLVEGQQLDYTTKRLWDVARY